jgi:hypothetical protein
MVRLPVVETLVEAGVETLEEVVVVEIAAVIHADKGIEL